MPDQYSTCGNSLNSHVNNFHKYFKHEFHDELYEQLALSGQPTRSYLTIAAAIIFSRCADFREPVQVSGRGSKDIYYNNHRDVCLNYHGDRHMLRCQRLSA